MIPFRKVGDEVACPICGKQYKYTEHHKFVRAGDFVCSWVCFRSSKDNAISANENAIVVEKRKRGRPKKSAGAVFSAEKLF